MLTFLTSILATALLAQSPDSIVLSGIVVDAAEKPLSGVEVALPARRPPDGSLPTLAQTVTDEKGAFRLEISRPRFAEIAAMPFIWAYRDGGAIAVKPIAITPNEPIPPIRITLTEPSPRALTIVGPDDRPLAGVRVSPVLYEFRDKSLFQTPDDRLDRLTIATGALGVATLPYFPLTFDLLTVRVNAPGISAHNLPLPARGDRARITLKLGRPARLAGSVYNDSGGPASNVPIEVWVENSYYWREQDRMAKVQPSLIRFDSGHVRTQADGSFLTPPQLLTGSTYRVIIRPEGRPMISSDWSAATAELTTVPPFRLKQHRKLLGFVHDRQGKPVAGARVFLPSGEPSTTTDAEGRYLLEGTLPDKTYLLVKAEGFRLQGWPSIPARVPQERKLILVRTSEPPDRTMATQPAPISFEESRALARRLLETYLQAALAKGEDNPKWSCLRLLTKIDPARVLELLEKHPLQNASADASIRNMVATELLGADPQESEAVVSAIASPELRALAYVWLNDALPEADRDRKRRFMELATVQARKPAVDGGDRWERFALLGRVAGGWLNLGETEKARPLIREGFELIAALPKNQRLNTDFLSPAARIEPDRVLSLIRNESSASRRRSEYAAVAESLAREHPAQAERVFQLIDDSAPALSLRSKFQLALRICRRLSNTDPERARRIIVGLKTPQEQARGWALLALGLSVRDTRAARSALDESIQLIDRLLEQAGAVKHPTTGIIVADNPAASILPIVERVAPERLEEVFWRAVTLMPRDDMSRQRGMVDPRVADSAIFLARYDRQVADVFLTQALSSQARSRNVYTSTLIRAMASVDPRAAVATIEALPLGNLDSQLPANQTREALVIFLLEPYADRWKSDCIHSGIPVDERRFP
jgi:hypothetical protein